MTAPVLHPASASVATLEAYGDSFFLLVYDRGANRPGRKPRPPLRALLHTDELPGWIVLSENPHMLADAIRSIRRDTKGSMRDKLLEAAWRSRKARVAKEEEAALPVQLGLL
jgi:hypothetical protein